MKACCRSFSRFLGIVSLFTSIREPCGVSLTRAQNIRTTSVPNSFEISQNSGAKMGEDLIKAAGIIMYKFDRDRNDHVFLLLKSSNKPYHWTPPKGRLDPGETLLQAAYRETEEEAGFTRDDIELDKDFQETLKYIANGKNKECTYYLGRLRDGNTKVVISDEHTDFLWVTADEMASYTDKVSLCEMLTRAKTRLKVPQE